MAITRRSFIRIGDTELYYEINGRGFPIVFIHAGVADHRMWDPQIAAFSRNFQVICYDMRGYGKSRPTKQPFSHFQDLFEFMKAIGISKAHLVGCSKGGGVAIDFTLSHPEMVSSVVLVSSAPNGFRPQGEFKPPTVWNDAVKAYSDGDLKRTAELEMQLWLVGVSRKLEEVPEHLRKLVYELDLIALTNEKQTPPIENPLQPNAATRIQELKLPVLLLVGELDDRPVIASAEELESKMKWPKRVIKGTAHLPNLEKPDIFDAEILRFLESLKSSEKKI